MNLTSTLICWTPNDPGYASAYPDTVGRLGLVSFPDLDGTSDRYAMSAGAGWSHVRNGAVGHRTRHLASELLTLYARDGIDPKQAHHELLALEEYRDLLPLDAIDVDRWYRIEKAKREEEE